VTEGNNRVREEHSRGWKRNSSGEKEPQDREWRSSEKEGERRELKGR